MIMRRTYCIYIVSIIMGVFLAGCDRTETDWMQAKQANTIPAYTEFLAKHSQGPFADEAKKAIDEIQWQAAKASDTVEAISSYLYKHPHGIHVVDANARIEELDWAAAQHTSNSEAFRAFLSKHRESRFAADAKEQLAKVEFERLSKSGSVSELKEYVHDFEGTTWSKQMQERLEGIRKALSIIEQTKFHLWSLQIADSNKTGFLLRSSTGNIVLSPSTEITGIIQFMFPNKDIPHTIVGRYPTSVGQNLGRFVTDKTWKVYCRTDVFGPSPSFMTVQRTNIGFEKQGGESEYYLLPEFPADFSVETEVLQIADRLPDQLSQEDYYILWRILSFRDMDKELKAKSADAPLDTLGVLRNMQAGGK
jgi:hypothetical protein